MALQWYLVGKRVNPDTGEDEPDTTASVYYALEVGTEFYLLTAEVLADPVLSRAQVEAQGLNYDRTISGA